MTTIASKADAEHSVDQRQLLDEIQTAAAAALHLVPMDTDNPSVHLGVRALVARTNEITASLHGIVSGDRSVPDLARLVPGAGSSATWPPHLELLMELDAIGDALLAIVRASGVEPADLHFFVACLQTRAGVLHDEWLTASNVNDDARSEDGTARPQAQTSNPCLVRIVQPSL